MNVGMRPGTRSIVLMALLAVLVTATFAAANDAIAGRWRTEMDHAGGKLIMVFEFLQDSATGRWGGVVRSNRGPQEGEELRAVSVTDRGVSFHTLTEVPEQTESIRSDFDLRLTVAGDELRGTMNVAIAGMRQELPVALTRVVERVGAEGIRFQPSRPFVGAWRAQPDRDDKQREIQLEILPDGVDYQGTLTDTAIEQTVAVRDLAIVDKENVASFNFRFEGAPFLSTFWGRYDGDRDQIRGTMSIGGRSQLLVFQRTSPGPESLLDDLRTQRRPLVRKHDHRFAATARAGYWQPLHVLKENVYNINDVTSSSFAMDAGVRFHLLDYVALQARYSRGGVGFDSLPERLALFEPGVGSQSNGITGTLNTDSYLRLDGWEISILAFLGQSIIPNSKFNPYVTAVIGQTTWELLENGRGSDPLQIFEIPVKGKNTTVGGGLGTEYAISPRFGVEFEWVWAYTNTEDDRKWEDVTYQWTSQHVYRFSLGGIFWF
ncbi:MAG: hypothetical protein PHQ53_06555 [Candidatus Krumholzibacteria bacterium]|nr:hypothetical protein [Candidatus Krumholzibacteria bacterium]